MSLKLASVGDDVLRMQGTEILVLGDLILDTYVSGKVSRISPEAPVPVVLEQKNWAVLGGAANVAANIVAFGGKVTLAGRVGRDSDGDRFFQICRDIGVKTDALIQSEKAPTTRKLRVMAGYQQVVRIDNESSEPLLAPEEKSLLQKAASFIQAGGSRAVVISDYGKGVCTPALLRQVLDLASDKNVPVVTDPKSLDMSRYAGSTVIKPNLSEGREALKIHKPGFAAKNIDEEIDAVCEAVLESSRARNVVLSLSERGVTLRGKDVGGNKNFASVALQVADVSGAGDTMIAFLAMGLAAGLNISRGVQLANIAAGIVCGKLGTSTVSASEFLNAFKHTTEETSPEKVLTRGDLARILSQARAAHKKVVFTNGCFDLLHAGHVETLQKARSCGDLLVVALNADESVRGLKGPTRPLQSESDRARILAALACVDYVTLFTEETPLELIKLLKPDILVKGGDYKVDQIAGAKEVLGWGGRIELIPLVEGRSTTRLVEKSKT